MIILVIVVDDDFVSAVERLRFFVGWVLVQAKETKER